MVIYIWLLVGFHPATRSVQSTPADNTRKTVWQYIEKERKESIRWLDTMFHYIFKSRGYRLEFLTLYILQL